MSEAGVITVGHGHADDQDHVHDYHRSFRLGVGTRDFAALVAGLRRSAAA